MKPGFLFNGINLLAVKPSRDCVDRSSSEQSFLIRFAKAFRKSFVEYPNCLIVNILHQPSAYRSDDLEPHFVSIAARMTQDSLKPLYANGRIDLNGPCRRVSGELSLGLACLCFSISSILIDNGRIPFDMLFVKSFKAPFAISFFITLFLK